jgi:DoxX-like family
MNTFLWVLQGVLAAVFAVSGALKSTMSKPRLIASGQTGVAPFPVPLIRFTAGCELLGVLGMVLPGRCTWRRTSRRSPRRASR